MTSTDLTAKIDDAFTDRDAAAPTSTGETFFLKTASSRC